MKVPAGLEHILQIDPEIMHGELCFKGSRVPLTVFLDMIAMGETVEEFLTQYPSVQRQSAEAILRWQDGALRDAAGLKRTG